MSLRVQGRVRDEVAEFEFEVPECEFESEFDCDSSNPTSSSRVRDPGRV